MIKNILNDLIDKNSTRNLSIKKILKKTHDNKKTRWYIYIYIYIYIYFFFDRKDIKVFVWGKLKRQLEHETKITNLTITDLKYFL
jgi:hypothetical protein